MLLREVAQAEIEGNPEEGYIINVAEHKTARVFGAAQLFLLPEEFSWIKRWVALRPRVVPKAATTWSFSPLEKAP